MFVFVLYNLKTKQNKDIKKNLKKYGNLSQTHPLCEVFTLFHAKMIQDWSNTDLWMTQTIQVGYF